MHGDVFEGIRRAFEGACNTASRGYYARALSQINANAT
jgi:hypothetical protein